ncbi:ferrous iron transport protein B [Sinobacterium caligoides]|uniref:Ferrous iron transport protein B n=1 Tax=Sinobacterium caligoides TaxID=933926 RepID=A0A3N2E1B9_9GAMM|nr:Fe(2+) transporter permease subunit FeoB [Sinobacterium caligoides]ROS05439.1 ferrous iron transport protein B [Sinobacterium caligoides]
MQQATIALVGNPNSGKTTLFNALTGTRQRVGNWPGVTVEKKEGRFNHAGTDFTLVDLPGTYSLHAGADVDSLDEQVAQQYVHSGEADLLLNIVDASSIERGLYMTTQLMNSGIPVVVALNMMDVADKHGVHIDPIALSKNLGCPVVPVIASRNDGIDGLLDVMQHYLERGEEGSFHLGALVEEQMALLAAPLTESAQDNAASEPQTEVQRRSRNRLLIGAMMEGDAQAEQRYLSLTGERGQVLLADCRRVMEGDISLAVIKARYATITTIAEQSVRLEPPKKTYSERFDDVLLNKWLAFPLFLGVMYLMFTLTINVGSAFIDFFDISANALFVEYPRMAMTAVGLPAWLIAILADGVGGGMQLVASFIPLIAMLFFCLSFLEDFGYMARAAFIVDRLMQRLGLPGKAFVPLIVGFGCNVPSVMSARTLDSASDRLLTTLMAPFMSCGARLTVYALFAAAFFPQNGQNIAFGLYFIGMALAVVCGLLLRKHLLSGERAPFIMELPAYHMPTMKGICILTWQRLKGFVMRAGKAIVIVVVCLNFVNSIGTDGSFGNQDTEQSALSAIGKSIVPLFEPMGMKEDNWPAAVGVFTGVFAKEVVVGTLDTLYGEVARQQAGGAAVEAEPFDGPAQFGEAVASIGSNLVDVMDNLGDPLGLSVGDVSDQAAAAEEQEVELSTLVLMRQMFDGQAAAFAYLLFVLLYMPCVATLGAIYKEAGGYWAAYSAAWNTLSAYTIAVIFYQLARVGSRPEESLAWVAAMLLALAGGYYALLRHARKVSRNSDLIPTVQL